MAYSRVLKATEQVARLSSTHTALLRQENKMNDQAEAARQPLVLALHKACAGTGVDVFELIQKLNEHNK